MKKKEKANVEVPTLRSLCLKLMQENEVTLEAENHIHVKDMATSVKGTQLTSQEDGLPHLMSSHVPWMTPERPMEISLVEEVIRGGTVRFLQETDSLKDLLQEPNGWLKMLDPL